MFYENELIFLREALSRCHMRSSVIAAETGEALSAELERLGGLSHRVRVAHVDVALPEPRTVYRYTDRLGRRYIYFALSSPASRIFILGPFLSASGEGEHGDAHIAREYHQGLPTFSEGDSAFILLDTFCERMWDTASFAVIDLDRENKTPESLLNQAEHTDDFDDLLANMHMMEQRYAFENEIIEAVSKGQVHKETALLSMLTDGVLERRTVDPLRNVKNYGIIMNTLLRKAAEKGGVHPLYLDRVSTDFALRIESTVTERAGRELMREMFRSYCRLVRKHTTGNYSRIVQNTVLIIDCDLAADLTLRSLAENQSISEGYLATVFKRETGKTVSEYIREKRMKHAEHLLTTTELQIQSVAAECGIVDLQYFSKMFKKHTGMTPKSYRENKKQNNFGKS